MAERMTYFITGGNRGIGYGLVTQLLARPNTLVIATTRPSSAFKDPLPPCGLNSNLVILPLDIASTSSYSKLLSHLSDVTTIDVVIANAGTHDKFLPICSTTPEEMMSVFQANTVGPILLFQTLWPFLSREKEGEVERKGLPKFFVMSSVLGSIEAQQGKEEACLSYGISKCGANFFVKRAHCEYENLVTVALHPGWVQTEMGQDFADSLGFKEPPLTVEQSVKGLLEQIDGATRENLSGKFVGHDGKIIPW